MFERRQLQEVLEAALYKGGDFADIFIEKKNSCSVSCEDDKIEKINTGTDCGAGIRVISGQSTAYAYTNELNLPSLIKAAESVSHAAAGGGSIKCKELNLVRPNAVFDYQYPPQQTAVADKAELIRKVNEAARRADSIKIKQVSVSYSDLTQNVVIANSEGVYAEDLRIRSRLSIQAVAAQGDIIQTGYDSMGSLQGFELFTQVNAEEKAEAAAYRAVAMLEAKPAPAGRMTVVMSAEAGGTMVHEACGHGLEADLVQKRLSVYAGKKDQTVAASNITVIDDGIYPDKYGSQSFDDEGTPAQKNVLIDQGKLTNYMYDRLTAAKEGTALTGNGRRQSYQHKPIPRMTNTYIASGDAKPEEIIRGVKSGLYVRKMGGGQVDTITGDFVFEVSEGYLIRDGEIGPLVRGATLTGNGPKVLKMIDMVGNDLGFSLGVCGKDGQGVPVGDAQPTIRIKELTVGGTAKA